jgi:pyruvate/2-oxoglutarate dehydrogenase complex dihydrolipoamide acyltransferase (E2) component
VDTLGHLLALQVTPADQGGRAQVEALAEEMQTVTGGTLELAYVDQGYAGPNAAEAAQPNAAEAAKPNAAAAAQPNAAEAAKPNAAAAAQKHGIRLEVVKHPMAKRGFVLLPCR